MTSASTYSEIEDGPRPEPDPHTVAVDALPQRQPPDLARMAILHGDPISAEMPTVILSQNALRQIDTHSMSNMRSELGGALLGHAYRHNGRMYTDVKAAIPAVSDDSGPVHFTFTADAWSHMHQIREAQYPDLDIVGWFHTHPDLGVFYSSDDVVVHSAAFTLPWHVGLVVDPVRRESSFFGWQGTDLVPIPGFYEKAPETAETVIDWRVVRTAVWTHGYDPGYAESSRVYLPKTQSPTLPALTTYAGLLAGLLGLLLAFFLLVGWVVPLTNEVNYLEDTVLSLASQTNAEQYALTCPDPRVRMLSPATGDRIPLGSELDVVGTAEFPDAARYELNVRPISSESWTLVNRLRRNVDLGKLGTWDTEPYVQGVYELRLTAVDRNNIRLPQSSPCTVLVELVP